MSAVAYIMQWEDHKNNVYNHLRVLFEEQKFVDVTLFCNTHSIRVHSVVIASNSSYFERVLLSQNGMNSVIVLKDMKFEILRALIEFMYCGETTVLDEDVDALLYASKRFEVRGLSRMTKQDVTYFAELNENENITQDLKLAIPAEPAQTRVMHSVADNRQRDSVLHLERGQSSYFQKTVLRTRTPRNRPTKIRSNGVFQETALSDTEYAIFKEAEESRRALEKLQKYVSDPSAPSGYSINSGPLSKRATSDNTTYEYYTQKDHSYSNQIEMNEDEIAANNLSDELDRQDRESLLTSSEIPADLPLFVDDGQGNYVTFDDEMAKLISGQEIKYHLVQGIVMTHDDKGNQISNPANILVPETGMNADEPEDAECFENVDDSPDSQPVLSLPEYEDISSDSESGNEKAEKKPFVVKEIIRVHQPKRKASPGVKGSGIFVNDDKDAQDSCYFVSEKSFEVIGVTGNERNEEESMSTGATGHSERMDDEAVTDLLLSDSSLSFSSGMCLPDSTDTITSSWIK